LWRAEIIILEPGRIPHYLVFEEWERDFYRKMRSYQILDIAGAGAPDLFSSIYKGREADKGPIGKIKGLLLLLVDMPYEIFDLLRNSQIGIWYAASFSKTAACGITMRLQMRLMPPQYGEPAVTNSGFHSSGFPAPQIRTHEIMFASRPINHSCVLPWLDFASGKRWPPIFTPFCVSREFETALC
jgi:hypothetical protein